METRLASKADAGLLASLHAESFGAARWGLAQIDSSLSLDTTLAPVALGAGKPLGFVLLQIAGEDAEILTFCVIPASRRKGVGSFLLNAVAKLAEAKGARCLFLEVAADNGPAVGLYEKFGFKSIGVRPGYYASGADAVSMAFDLQAKI